VTTPATTTTAKLCLVADKIEFAFPEEAALLRTIRLGRKQNPKPPKHTERSQKYAEVYYQIDTLITQGLKKRDAINAVSDGMKIDKRILDDVYAGKRGPVNKILREWGILPPRN
jgi:hypothetical protein